MQGKIFQGFLQAFVFFFKDDVKPVLRTGSAHNKGGPFSDIKFQFIFIYEHSKPEQIDI